MAKRHIQTRHYFHIVDQSPWPFLIACSLFLLTTGAVRWFHYNDNGLGVLFGLLFTLMIMIVWWRDVVREGTFEGHHTLAVQRGLRYGFSLFILSEVMFFFSFFWAFFNSSLSPDISLGCMWPPVLIHPFDFMGVPLLNTGILVLSGATITWAHYALLTGSRGNAHFAFFFTLLLALAFTGFQAMEYLEAPFSISDGAYGTTFFMLTGFHGFHVIVGSIFIAICYFRFIRHHFTRKHHLGFEFAAWYWHFVDIVWLFLYIMVYVWGSYSI